MLLLDDIPATMFYTIEETAAMLRCSPFTVMRWLREGRVKTRVARMGRRVVKVIGQSEFLELYAERAKLVEELDPNDHRARTLAFRERLSEARRIARDKRKAAASDPSSSDPSSSDPSDPPTTPEKPTKPDT